MSKFRSLSKQQIAVLDDLFAGDFDEQEVLDKHGVHPDHFEKWLADASFVRRFEQRLARAHRQSRLILARYAPLAAAKLVELTHSEKQETARKACLDIIALQSAGAQSAPEARLTSERTERLLALPPEAASRLLAALAQEPPDNGSAG